MRENERRNVIVRLDQFSQDPHRHGLVQDWLVDFVGRLPDALVITATRERRAREVGLHSRMLHELVQQVQVAVARHSG